MGGWVGELTPTLVRGGMEKERPFSTHGWSFLYLTWRLLISILPSVGQGVGGWVGEAQEEEEEEEEEEEGSSSCGRCMKSRMRSTLFILCLGGVGGWVGG